MKTELGRETGPTIDDVRKSIHVATVIRERTEGFVPLEGAMTDSIVAGSFRANKDGSITIRCQITVHDGKTGELWIAQDRKILLKLKRTT